MPRWHRGRLSYVEVDFEKNGSVGGAELHKGPNNSSKSVLEVKTVDRIYTLYTDDC